MAATLTHLRRLTRERLGVPVSDDFFTDDVVDDHINLAVQAIDAEARWPWTDGVQLADLDVGTPDIEPPDGYRATRSIMWEGVELAAVAPADLMAWDLTTGLPSVWCPMNGLIAVRPKASGPLQLIHYYLRQSTWLRADADVPLIPEQFTGAIVAKAAELLSARESSGGDATRHGAEYAAWVTRMRRDMRRVTGPARTRVRPGGWV